MNNNNINNHNSNEQNGAVNGEVTQFNIKKGELVRLILQALQSLNFNESAQLLEKESGIQLHSPSINEFRYHVLHGTWDKVIASLPDIGLAEKHKVQNVKFLIYRQKYLELLSAKKSSEALQTLRQELAPVTRDASQLHKLTSLIMCQSLEELQSKSKWQESLQLSRQVLLDDIHKYIPSSKMVPENRLQKLLLLALDKSTPEDQTLDAPISLLDEETNSSEMIPRDCIHVLEHHLDEVWHVQFSPDGQFLATCGADKKVFIYQVSKLGEKSYKPLQLPEFHTNIISLVSWSPNSQFLLTCSLDKTVKLWQTSSGTLLHSFEKHRDAVAGVAWLPDSTQFISAGGKNDKTIRRWNVASGDQIECWKVNFRVHDIAVSADGSKLVLVAHNKRLYVSSPISNRQAFHLTDTEYLTSVTLSPCGRFALCSLSREDGNSGRAGLHLWDLEERQLVKEYLGNRQVKFVLRNSFGGRGKQACDSLIVCGSEDAKVYLWDKTSTRVVAMLEGHSNAVTAVHWNPKNPFMFASASDDGTVRIWSYVDRVKDL